MNTQLTVSDKAANQVLSLIPSDFPAKAFGGNRNELLYALRTCMKNEALAQCTPQSIFDCITQADGLGLSFNPSLHHVYLIPYKGVCTLILGYKGKMLLMEPDMVVIDFGVVRVGDVFEEVDKPGFPYRHRKRLPKPGEDLTLGEIYAAYAVAKRCGEEIWVLLNLAELKSKDSLSQTDKFRKKYPAEMYIKDAINSLANRYPLTSTSQMALMENERSVEDGAWQEADTQTTIASATIIDDDEAQQIRYKFQLWYDSPERTDAEREEVATWKAAGPGGRRTDEERKQFLAMKGVFLK